jgi:NADH:ubiquinone oxidoreductase subunit 4 (subunit M)
MVVAYSSIVHMLIVVVCVFGKFNLSVLGLIMLSIGHGFTSSALFYFIGNFYSNRGTRNVVINAGKI